MPVPVIAAAVVGAGAIGAAAIGSKASKSAAKTASNAAQYAADQNAQIQREIYSQNKGVLEPFTSRGNAAGAQINALLGLNDNASSLQGTGGVYGNPPTLPGARSAFDAFRSSTGYDFRLGEGMNALNSKYAARGLLNSGAARKDAIRFGQNLGSEEFGNYLGYLGNQQGVGLSSASALAGVGQGFANSITANNNALASVKANAALAGAQNTNALLGTAAGVLGNVGGQLISSYGGAPGRNPYGIAGGALY